jgi:hypothetical protein
MKPQNKAQPETRREEPSLDHRYGQIGISAVAAALRYQSDAKKPANAPAAPRKDDAYAEARA